MGGDHGIVRRRGSRRRADAHAPIPSPPAGGVGAHAEPDRACAAALAGPAPTAAVAAGAFAAGAGLAFYNTLIETTMQRTVEPGVLSRLASIDWMFSNCLFPAGAAIAGPVAALVGARGVLVASAAWMVASSCPVLGMRPIRTFRALTPADDGRSRPDPGPITRPGSGLAAGEEPWTS